MSGRFAAMNPRERRLLAVTLSVVLIAGLFLGVRGALLHLRDLDGRIGQLEFELENLKQQYVQRDAVDAAYNAVITEHSSSLTVAEIHDHLRREIFKLAQVPLPATEDKPERVMQLVRIPTLEMGELKETNGHREYHIRFDIPAARLDRLLGFLQRIETSDQLLRIDRVEVGRVPGTQRVHAALEITRTVLDNPESAAAGTPA